MFQAVIFDMDGTLISTEKDHETAAVRALKHFGVPEVRDDRLLERIAVRASGTTNQRTMQIIIEELNLDLSSDMLVRQKSAELRKIYESKTDWGLNPGVASLIENLYRLGLRMAVASSSPYDEILYLTERFGICKYFDLLFSGDFVPRSKPEPDIFLETARKLDVKPSHCLVFEDSKNGVEAAKAAGMFTVGYNNPQTPSYDLSRADLQIDDYRRFDIRELPMGSQLKYLSR
ncbi:MAG: HAD family phosphatase [Peptostreptococcaceae bacterium]|nr:HAD family phosphatase [Peptostreptococcaceae bacterium]